MIHIVDQRNAFGFRASFEFAFLLPRLKYELVEFGDLPTVCVAIKCTHYGCFAL